MYAETEQKLIKEIALQSGAIGLVNLRVGILARKMNDMAGSMKAIAFRTGRPPFPSFQPVSKIEENHVKKIIYDATLAAETDSTTVSRELSVQVADAAPVVLTVPVTQTVIPTAVKGPIGAVVHVEQVDIDEVGNRSQPAVVDFAITDCLPPLKPGVPGFVPTSEVEEA